MSTNDQIIADVGTTQQCERSREMIQRGLDVEGTLAYLCKSGAAPSWVTPVRAVS
jgi:hypothetical protein